MTGRNDLQEIRGSKAWRAAVWGMRVMLCGFLAMIVGVVLLAAGVAVGGGVAGFGLAGVFIGLPIGLIGVAAMTKRTSAYTGVSAGQPSPARMWQGVKAAASDVFSMRRPTA